jgi:hypothetical protein
MGCVFFLVYAAVMVPSMIALLAVAAFSLRSEGRAIQTYLATDLESGVLSPTDYQTLCSVRGRLRASLRTLTHEGWSAWRRRQAFHQAASELAFHRHRVADGDEPADAEIEAAFLNHLLTRPGADLVAAEALGGRDRASVDQPQP